jgi:hypothetical protein
MLGQTAAKGDVQPDLGFTAFRLFLEGDFNRADLRNMAAVSVPCAQGNRISKSGQ